MTTKTPDRPQAHQPQPQTDDQKTPKAHNHAEPPAANAGPGKVGSAEDLAEEAEDLTPGEEADYKAEKAGKPFGKHYKFLSPTALEQDDCNPPEAILEGILPVTGLMTMSSRAKSHKTWGAVDLALSVAAGVQWLGRSTRRGKAIYVNFELSEGSLKFRVKKIAAAKGISLRGLEDWFTGLSVDTGALLMNKDEIFKLVHLVMRQIDKAITEWGDPVLVILDSFYNLASDANENDIADVTGIYQEIKSFSERHECAVVMVHHFSKGDQSKKSGGDRAGGSRAHFQFPNTYVEFVGLDDDMGDQAYGVHIDCRDYEAVPSFSVRWEFPLLVEAPDLDPFNLKKVTRRGRKSVYTVNQILGHLGDRTLAYGEWQRACQDEIGMSQSTFDRLLESAKELGQITVQNRKYSKSDDGSVKKPATVETVNPKNEQINSVKQPQNHSHNNSDGKAIDGTYRHNSPPRRGDGKRDGNSKNPLLALQEKL